MAAGDDGRTSRSHRARALFSGHDAMCILVKRPSLARGGGDSSYLADIVRVPQAARTFRPIRNVFYAAAILVATTTLSQAPTIFRPRSCMDVVLGDVLSPTLILHVFLTFLCASKVSVEGR